MVLFRYMRVPVCEWPSVHLCLCVCVCVCVWVSECVSVCVSVCVCECLYLRVWMCELCHRSSVSSIVRVCEKSSSPITIWKRPSACVLFRQIYVCICFLCISKCVCVCVCVCVCYPQCLCTVSVVLPSVSLNAYLCFPAWMCFKIKGLQTWQTWRLQVVFFEEPTDVTVLCMVMCVSKSVWTIVCKQECVSFHIFVVGTWKSSCSTCASLCGHIRNLLSTSTSWTKNIIYHNMD